MRLLFLTQRLPYAPNKGDRVRAFHELRMLAQHYDVHVVSLVHDEDEASHAADLQGTAASVDLIPVTRVRNLARAVATLATRRPLTHALLAGSSARSVLASVLERFHPDCALAFCSSMARFALEPPVAGLPFVLDMVDVDSAKWAALSRTAALPRRYLYAREANVLAKFESHAVRRAATTFVVNTREATLLRNICGSDARVEVLQNGVDVPFWKTSAGPANSNEVVFCGVMDYAPNEQAALWLATEIWPLVVSRVPSARLTLVGSNPTRALRQIGDRVQSITVTGTVPDVRPYLWRAAVAVAPLLVARGVQNKVLEAVAAGLPAVVTTAVLAGLPAQVARACFAADEAGNFADSVAYLLQRPAYERRAIATSACLDGLRWESRLEPLIETLRRRSVALRSGDA